MSPFQHGEVFVTEDGAETDLDIGHYERFIDENLSRNANHTPGAIWDSVLAQGAQGRVPRRDRAGDPAHHERDQGAHPPRRRGDRRRRRHHRDRRHGRRHRVAAVPRGDPPVPRARSGRENVLYLHVTLVPFIDAAGELKTKPTQHSVNELRRIGIHPTSSSAARARRSRATSATRSRSSPTSTPSAVDRATGRARRLPRPDGAAGARASTGSSASKLGLDAAPADLGEWQRADRADRRARRATVEIALVGKYVKLHDAYLSVHEALKHAGVHHGCRVRVRWVDAEDMSLRGGRPSCSSRSTACSSPAASARAAGRARSSPAASRASAGSRTSASASACTSPSPSSRGTSCGLEGANSTEMDPETPYPVIDLLPEQKEIEDLGGTMRLGAQAVELAEGTRTREAYGEPVDPRAAPAPLRGEQPATASSSSTPGLVVSGTFQEGRLVEIVELPDHPWFVASQFHPEFKSRPTRPGAALPRVRRRRASTAHAGAPVDASRLAGRSARARPT